MTKPTNTPTTATRVREPGPVQEKRRPSRRVAFVIAGAVVLVVLAVWVVAFSPLLGVKTVTVRGTGFLTAAQIRTAAAITHGTPLLRLDTAAIVRRVDRLAEVKSAAVTTSYPNTVTITVIERAPVGYLDSGQGKFVLVDASGAQFRTVQARPTKLPLFVVPTDGAAGPSAAAVATVAGDLSAALLGRIRSIQALDPTAITLLLTDSRVVRWGSVERSADKARILPALLQQPGSQFDVSNPDQVIAR